MLEGLLTGQMQGITPRDRETHHVIHLLDGAADAEPCLAVKTIQIRLRGDFTLLTSSRPFAGLNMPRLQSLLASLNRRFAMERSR